MTYDLNKRKQLFDLLSFQEVPVSHESQRNIDLCVL